MHLYTPCTKLNSCENLNYSFIMNVQIFYIATYGIVVIVNPFTAITIIWPIQAITNMYMLSSSRYILDDIKIFYLKRRNRDQKGSYLNIRYFIHEKRT